MFEAATTFAGCLNYSDPYWLTLAGPSGIGKTMLAKEIWKQFMTWNRFELKLDVKHQHIYGNTGMNISWREHCAAIRSGLYESTEDIIKEHFVILDDIATERDPTGMIASILDRILSARLNKWTLITVNLTLEQIAERIDPRVASRMLRNGSQVVECSALDYNLR